MATLHMDKVENLNAKEVYGVIRSLTRKAKVEFTKAEIANSRNQNVLDLALTVLDNNGYKAMAPVPGTTITSSRYGALVCVERIPSISDNDPCWVEIILNYQHILDGPNQILKGPVSGLIFSKGKSSIVDKSTNFFYPFGDKSKNRILLQTAHKYGEKDQAIAGMPLDPDFPRTVFQGGEINIPFPQANISFQGLIATTRPRALAKSIIGTVNGAEFMGDPTTYWLCSEVAWEVNDPTTHLATGGLPIAGPNYKFTFEFQYNDDGWDPTIVFLDQRMSKPPPDVLFATTDDETANGAGVLRMVINDAGLPLGNPQRLRPAGIWQVAALRRLDFNAFFGAVIEAAAPPEVV